MKHHKKRYSRKTDKQGIHANEYQDMAIRSLDNTQKEKKKIGSARIPEKESIPSVQSVSKPHKDEAIEGNKIAIPTKDSSNNDSTPSVVDDPRTKKPDPGDLVSKGECKRSSHLEEYGWHSRIQYVLSGSTDAAKSTDLASRACVN